MFDVKELPVLSHERFRLGIAAMDALTKHIEVVISNLVWLIKYDDFEDVVEKSGFRLTFPFQVGAGYWEVSLHRRGIDAITFWFKDASNCETDNNKEFLRITQWDGRSFIFCSSREKYRWVSVVYNHLQDLVQGIVVAFPQITSRMKHFDDMADRYEGLLSKR